MRDRSTRRFQEAQQEHFLDADEAQYRWTTAAPGIAESEDELLLPVVDELASPCLEVGCGEGNNLARLSREPERSLFGIDRFARKLHFAKREFPRARFAAADAAALPFGDESFRSVFVRDVLHHVPAPATVMAEAVRVLAPGGRLVLLEPNGRNPLIRLQTHLVPAEIGARTSNAASIEAVLAGLPLEAVEVFAAQPLALRRLALHYKMGLPALGRNAITGAALRFGERALGALLPRSRWTYVVAAATRSDV